MAATVFSQQLAPPGSGCFLQSRFLATVASNYEDFRHQNSQQQRLEALRANIDHHSDISTADTGARDTTDDLPAPEAMHAPTQTALCKENGPPPAASMAQSSAAASLQRTSQRIGDTRGFGSAERTDCILTDNDMWADVFANAGFNIQDGFFFS